MSTQLNDPSLSDQQLVAEARAGSTVAFAMLTERYYGKIWRFLLGQSRDPDLADDLTQETFLLAFDRLAQLADDGAFPPWLYRIARNRLRSHGRRSALRQLLPLDWLEDRGRTHAALVAALDVIEQHERRDLIASALSGLRPAYREAVLLRHLDGFSYEEIGQILGISAGAAKKRCNRATRQFRKRYIELTDESIPEEADYVQVLRSPER